LQNADAAALTISPIEFERAIEHCKDLSEKVLEKERKARVASATCGGGCENFVTLCAGNTYVSVDGEQSMQEVKLLKNKSILEIYRQRSHYLP